MDIVAPLIALAVACAILLGMRYCFIQGERSGDIHTRHHLFSTIHGMAYNSRVQWQRASDLQRGDWTSSQVEAYSKGLEDAANFAKGEYYGKQSS